MGQVKDLIVLSVGPELPSKIPGKIGTSYRRIQLKNVDEEDKTSYAMNLNKIFKNLKEESAYGNWLNNLVPGAVLQVQMQDKNPMNVDQYRPFKIVKKANEAPKKTEVVEKNRPYDKPDEGFKLYLSIELGKIQTIINNLKKEFEI